MTLFRIPNKKWKIILISAISYLLWPIVEYIWYSQAQREGIFSVNADTISIPLFQSIAGWMLVIPFYCLIIWFSTRKYSGNISIFIWPKVRKLWNISWTIFWSLIVCFELSEIYRSIVNEFYFDTLFWILQIWLALSFRALIVSQK